MKSFLPRKVRYTLTVSVLSIIVGMLVSFGLPKLAFADQKDELLKFWSDTYGNLNFSEGGGIFGYNRTLLAKAQPDECFQGVGNPLNLTDPVLGFIANYPGNLTDDQIEACRDIVVSDPSYPTLNGHAQPKTNQAYVWGLTRYGDKLWFGTAPNTPCWVVSGYLGASGASLNNSWVCEGGQKDFRPPRVYYYDLTKKALVDVTQQILDKGDPNPDAELLRNTLGIRAAGSAGGVAFLGGVGTAVNLFAFNAQTGQYLGSISYDGKDGRPLYTNIRQWLLVKNGLYVGVGKSGGGEILRWKGKLSTNISELFSFETVGTVEGDPAYIATHESRLFVSTWPVFSGFSALPTEPMSLYMSPVIGPTGKLAPSTASWPKVWQLTNYEPEDTVAKSTGGGALMSYKGYLYWGTMHVPGLNYAAWELTYPNATDEEKLAAILGTYRAISLFRGKNFGTSKQQVELLYGNTFLPKYTSGTGWTIVPNKLGQLPKYGLAGFNNLFNNYTWWMEVFQDQLFVGTMDFSYLLAEEIGPYLGQEYASLKTLVDTLGPLFFGADLWRFPSSDAAAVPVSLNGVGNYMNYGIRAMVSSPDALYLGSANPMNLLTDPNGDKPLGGWELIKLMSGSN